jgi:hypothetical protein
MSLPQSAQTASKTTNPTVSKAEQFVKLSRGLARLHNDIHLGMALDVLRGDAPAADDTERLERAHAAVAVLSRAVRV